MYIYNNILISDEIFDAFSKTKGQPNGGAYVELMILDAIIKVHEREITFSILSIIMPLTSEN